jgi:glycosyltransferase involved in cell wall biosynthesis
VSAGRVLLFIPAYNCAPQIGRVVAQLEAVKGLIDEVVVVDNQSPDETLERATEALRRVDGLSWRVLRNDDNYGLGGSHKVAIAHGLENGFDWLLVLHGDDQADVRDIVPLLESGDQEGVDALLGARFMRGARLQGYSRVRTLGNHVYNLLFSAAGRRRMHDLGSGLNLFRLGAFSGSDGDYLRFADDLTFNYYLSLYMADRGWRQRYFPISWREEDQRSNVNLVRQGMSVLGLLGDFMRDRKRFFATDHSRGVARYTAKTVARSNGNT